MHNTQQFVVVYGVECWAEIHIQQVQVLLAYFCIWHDVHYICSCRIVFFCFLKPSCVLLRMLKCSAYLYKHSAITPVHSLYRVFASAIGLQFPKSCALPLLFRSTVWDSFHALGVVSVIHIKMNNLWMTWCIPTGRCLSSSFGMPSGPLGVEQEAFRPSSSPRLLSQVYIYYI